MGKHLFMDIALIGFGNVGRGFINILQSQYRDICDIYGCKARLVALVTRTRGTLYDPNGLDLATLGRIGAEGGDLSAYPDTPTLARDWDARRIAAESSADVLIEATPTDLVTAQPALDVCRLALDCGKHLVLANKGPVAVDYADLYGRSRMSERLLRFEATVMAGTPALRLGMVDLAGSNITAVKGILNGTTNYMLGLMEKGTAYAEALADAQANGYAESDPSGDVDGHDAAAKAMIIAAALFHAEWKLDHVETTGISGLDAGAVQAAYANGERYKLLAEITADGARVAPVRLPLSHPLAQVSGTDNAITYSTEIMGDITLVGRGAGREETGFAILSDLLDIHRSTR